MSEKADRKELRQPDEFQVVAGRVLEWIVARQQQLLIAIGAVVAVALLAWAVSSYMNSRETSAGAALTEAVGIAARPIAGEGFVPPGADTFPSKEERSKAALAALEKVRADAPSTHAGRTALAQVGFVKAKAGDNAGAAQALSDFLAQADKADPLRVFAIESLGYALEAQGKLDDAKAAFARLADAGAPARAAFQEARLALVQGKPEAKGLLEAVAKDYPKDPVAAEAQQRLELASLPPPPPPGSVPVQDATPAPAAEPKGAKKAAPAKPAVAKVSKAKK